MFIRLNDIETETVNPDTCPPREPAPSKHGRGMLSAKSIDHIHPIVHRCKETEMKGEGK